MAKNNTALAKQLIVKYAKRYGVNPYLALALAKQESGFGQYDNKGNIKKSKAGALGVMQLMPDTAKGLKVDPNNMEQNIEGGVRYLKAKLNEFGGDIQMALASYNAGSSAVKKYKGIPPYKETQNYVKTIMGSMNNYQKDSSVRNIIGSEYNIANNDTTLNSKGEEVKMASNQISGMPTGGAIDMGATLADMYNRATREAETPANIQYNAQQQFLNTLDDPRVQARLNRQVGFTPEQINAIQNPQLTALQAMQAQNNTSTQGYAQMLQDLYNRQNEVIMSDPRLQNMGYNTDIDTLSRNIDNRAYDLRIYANRAAMNGDVQTAAKLSEQALALEQSKDAQINRAKLANQYGIDYDLLTAANNERISRQLAAMQAQGASLDALIKQAQAGDVNAINALKPIVEGARDITKESLGKQADYDKEVTSQMIQGLRDVNAPAVNAYSAQATQGMGNAADLAKQILQGEYGLTEKEADAAIAKYNTDINAQTERMGQVARSNDVKYSSDAGYKQAVDVANIGQPAKNLTAVSNLYGNTSQVMGYTPAQQTGIVQNLPAEMQSVVRNLKMTPANYTNMVQGINPNQAQAPTSTAGLLGLWNRGGQQ